MLGLIRANLRRRLARTLLTATGIAVGVGTVVALLALTAGIERSAAGLIHLGRADFGLFQAGVADPTASKLPTSLVPRIKRQPGVAMASPIQLVVNALPGQPSFLVFGVEQGSFVGKRLVITGGREARGDEAMLGDAGARRLKLDVGDSLELTGGTFPIVGIYHAGVSFEDAGVVLPLAVAQRLAGAAGQATTIAVSVIPSVGSATVIERLEKTFPGTVSIAQPGDVARADTNSLLINKAVLVIVVLALIIGGITVTNTMVMSVLERQGELALLAAVGWHGGQIARLIFGEGVSLSLIGASLGLLLGIAASEIIVRVLDVSALVSPHFTAWGLGRGLIVGVAIGVLGGLYPAWRVTRLAPARALAR